jgi:hypothetical protein
MDCFYIGEKIIKEMDLSVPSHEKMKANLTLFLKENEKICP